MKALSKRRATAATLVRLAQINHARPTISPFASPQSPPPDHLLITIPAQRFVRDAWITERKHQRRGWTLPYLTFADSAVVNRHWDIQLPRQRRRRWSLRVTQSTVSEWSCTTLQKHPSVKTPYLFAVERHHTKSKSISLQILKLSDFRPSDTTQILKPSNFRPWHKKSILIPKLKSSQVRSATLKPSQHRTPRQKPSQFRCSHENQANDGPIKIESI